MVDISRVNGIINQLITGEGTTLIDFIFQTYLRNPKDPVCSLTAAQRPTPPWTDKTPAAFQSSRSRWTMCHQFGFNERT